MELLTDPAEIEQWISTWKDERVVIFDDIGSNINVPRLNGTYTIRPDGIVDVDGGVYLKNMHDLDIIPIQFGEVTEDFECDNTDIITLEHCPSRVGKNFTCHHTKITSLKGAPHTVGGDFWCTLINITSLKGAPCTVGRNFNCGSTHILTLEHCPRIIGGDFYYSTVGTLITNGFESEVGGSIQKRKIQLTLEERCVCYATYLNTISLESKKISVAWLGRVDGELNEAFMKYAMKNGLGDLYSDEVRNIVDVTLNSNHRL